ncbi:type II toxin-antitoxin system HigB family toxin [Deinococcus koreensis]|uniref:Addiction module toxin RelE n=1 Tax=Deinococcus koreensis TaxID=2054903 RepID=A0A2K3UTP1_9DEIO|nr:type II toxin-antitoxin system HigB family toxin [Deinococcus koreensis]PNY79902.1 addiction module toxin RelE [Deinococcus koreensis]
MNVISPRTLAAVWAEEPEAEEPLREWLAHVQGATYHTFADVRADYGSADWVAGYIVFNIGGNKYRLIVSPNFAGRFRTFFVKFIGTHKDYDRLDLERDL